MEKGRKAAGLRLALLIALALGVVGTALAQGTLGRLAGVATDSSGAVLPGATVRVINVGTNQTSTAVTAANGTFAVPQLPAGTYHVVVELPNFRTATYTDVVINVGQEYSLNVTLDVGDISETVEVSAGTSLVRTTTPEVSSTVLQKQVLDIPLANRDVTNLIKMQPGVQPFMNRTNTSINGGRPTWTQVTLDGINIQDNFIRVNSLDFLPNRPTSDTVAEFTITSALSGADTAGGATTVRMITPSGTNQLRGSVFEFNRDNRFAANSFFNNASGVSKPELSRHQFGGRVGGPIMRNKLFFFGYYEGFRQTTQTAQNLVIPANADFFDGFFRYVALDGAVRAVNVTQLSGLPIDARLRSDVFSKVPGPGNVNNFNVGNSNAARLLNTAGYRFNQTDLNDRNQYGFRIDYELNQRHRFEGGYHYFRETDDRTDLDYVSTDRPLVYTNSNPKRFALAWRWLASSRLQNEVRGGGNLAPVAFDSDWKYEGALYNTVLGISNPIGGWSTNGASAGFQPQGRYTNTYQLGNNATMMLGRHDLQFGGSWQRNRVNPYNFAGQFPVVTFGFSAAAPSSVQLTSGMFPGGISATDLNNANLMAAWLGGIVSSVSQTYQVASRTSGYVPGIPSDENYTLDNIAVYMQDNWRWKPNFTIRAGLKWEYYSPLREDDDLGFLPVLGGRNFQQAMLDPNTNITFVSGGYYKKDLNNFGPTVGFAWDVTRDGKTAVRGGYSLTFVNEESVTVGRSAARGNAGLTTTVNLANQYRAVSAGVPLPTTPAFLSERTQADQLALTPTPVLWGLNPNLTAPHVHQLSVGIQRELRWSTAVEARYVGTFGRQIWRGMDFNQMSLPSPFLADFERARQNGYAAQAAGLAFSPAFNPAVPGSQPLTVLPTFGLLTNATVINRIQTNQPAALADFYVSSRVAGSRETFLPNPMAYASNGIVNGAFSDYNALQIEFRRQYRRGFFGQLNYTLSDTHTDSIGTGQNRFEAFMDNNRPELSTGRSLFHVTHILAGNALYELPFGMGKRWLNRGGLSDAIVGGWQVSSIVAWSSGSPFTIFSGRGTVNRIGRSDCSSGGILACNTAFSTMSVDEIKKLIGLHKTPDGRVYWIDPKVIDPGTGRAVGADNLTNAAGFPGQVFFNVGGQEVGSLPILAFDGPPQFRIDMAVSKRFRISDRYRFEVKGEAFNLTNTPSFFRGDMDVNSTTFGRITSVNVGSRVLQFSGRFDF
jgi:hypothetical protein